MNIHFIAIGGSAMHNLAIALHLKGYHITGSDDEIFDPAKSRLERYGLLPKRIGWDPQAITSDLDAVVLGMHARTDNPELLRAQELHIRIYSYPEFLFEQSKDKTRIVIGGSHGKTSITAMLLHVFERQGLSCDYMVGAQLEGFDVMVRLTSDAPYMIIEGDEYLTSPIDRRPKFHVYRPHLALINGIAWDHINVFPTFSNYVSQFKIFTDLIEPNGMLAYYEADPELAQIALSLREDILKAPYGIPEHRIIAGKTIVCVQGQEFELQVFGRHNLQNMSGALQICRQVGIEELDFWRAIESFKGASKRLELVGSSDTVAVYKDFAHSPSKLQATVSALKEQYPERALVACIELHTFSSLNADFLEEYRGTFDQADLALVYFNPHTIAHKKLSEIKPEFVKSAFGRKDLHVCTDSKQLKALIESQSWKSKNLLLMSSGNFDGIDEKALAENLVSSCK